MIAGLGYYLLTQNQSSALNNMQVNSQAAVKTAESLRKVQELETIELDGSFFSDPRFNGLVDLTENIVPVPHGKSNPFVEGN